MTFDRIILWIMAVGVLLGALDKLMGNHFGLGEKFEEGLKLMGPLALGMVGMVCLAPVLAGLLQPVLTPLCAAIGLDPAILGGLLANDMGGYALAAELAVLPQAGQYVGILVSAMLGCTLVFTIPVGLGLLPQEAKPPFFQGLLLGLVTLPIGCMVGGLTAGFAIDMLLRNTLPFLILSVLLAIGIRLRPAAMIAGCTVFGKIISAVITLGLGCAAFTHITGVPLIKGLTPITEAMQSVAGIAVVLMGTFPMLSLLNRALKKPLQQLARRTGLDTDSIIGLIVGLANSVPVFGMMKQMNKRGIVLNAAWLVSGSAALGAHLGFTAGVEPGLIGAMLAGKLTAAALALLLAIRVTGKKPSGGAGQQPEQNA